MFAPVPWSVSSILSRENPETLAPLTPPGKYKKSFRTKEIAHARKSLYVWDVGFLEVKDARSS
jgi:hypothetical protein